MLRLDKLYDLTAVGIKNASLRMLMTVQRERPEAVVAAIATLMLTVSARYGVDPRRVLETTDRIIRVAKDEHPVEMRALARYLKEELPDA